MEKRIKFLGISFRSRQHLNWFKFSTIMFIAGLVLLVLSLFYHIIPQDPVLRIYMLGLAYLHGLTFLMALAETRMGKISNNRLSIDCVWFNGVMMIVYIVLLIILLQG